MQKDNHFVSVFRFIRHRALPLLFFCVLGLLLGTLLAAHADESVFSWMRRVHFDQVSIVFSLAAQLLPFLIAAYAVSISRPWLLYTVCGCRLFCFAYLGALVWNAFGTAGWLVRFLLFFCDIFLVPLLCWYCFRRVMGEYDEKKELLTCIGIAAITVLLNWLFFSPLLARIL
ncbi:MAG: hypothetical protein IJN60_01800 [Oscillospiraceae bacterium]|nr:hypothetical protein [Oscillospiraceae bacterium]